MHCRETSPPSAPPGTIRRWRGTRRPAHSASRSSASWRCRGCRNGSRSRSTRPRVSKPPSAQGRGFQLPIPPPVLLSPPGFDISALGDIRNVRLVGLRNFSRLLADPLFWTSMRNTFYFVLVGGPLTLGVALAAALLLHSKLVRWKGLFRTIFFAPYITTLVAVAIVFRYLYHPRFGGLNRVLELFGISAIDWLGDPRWAMPAIILLAIW